MSDYAAERERVLAKREAEKEREMVPRILLHEVRPGATEEELAEAALSRWPNMDEDRRGRIVRRAREIQAEGRAVHRRVDPKEIEGLKHPSERESEMAVLTTTKVQKWIRGQLKDQPAADPDQLFEKAQKEIPGVSRRSFGQNLRVIRDELGGVGPAKNGKKPTAVRESAAPPKPEGCGFPRCTLEDGHAGDHDVPGEVTAAAPHDHDEPPAEPSAREAEPVGRQVTERVEGTGKALQEAPPRTPAHQEPHPYVGRGGALVEESERMSLERRVSYGPRRHRVQVEVDPATGTAHIFADVDGLPPAVAYRVAAQLQIALAEAQEAAA